MEATHLLYHPACVNCNQSTTTALGVGREWESCPGSSCAPRPNLTEVESYTAAQTGILEELHSAADLTSTLAIQEAPLQEELREMGVQF